MNDFKITIEMKNASIGSRIGSFAIGLVFSKLLISFMHDVILGRSYGTLEKSI